MSDDGLNPARWLVTGFAASMPAFAAALMAIEPNAQTAIAAVGASVAAWGGLAVVRAFDLDDPARQMAAAAAEGAEPVTSRPVAWEEAA